jgi:hypothetical protein
MPAAEPANLSIAMIPSSERFKVLFADAVQFTERVLRIMHGRKETTSLFSAYPTFRSGDERNERCRQSGFTVCIQMALGRRLQRLRPKE